MAPEARVAFAAAPIMSAARIPSVRPTTAPLRPRAPDTMIDTSPSARLPGYTGHVPGITSDSLLGRSYAYTTGFRKDLLSASEAHISEYKRAVAEGTHFAPKQYTRVVDASKVSRPMQAPDALRGWKSKEQYNQTLDLSADGRMPGYTGHVPHFKFQGSVGLPFAKACQYKDHLRPADGSHNVYKHEEPHHKGGVKHTAEPATGYSGYMPFVQTQGMNVPYMRNVDLSVQLRKVNPADLRKDLDQTNAAYTPSMHEPLRAAAKEAATPRSIGTPRTPRPVNPCEDKTFAVGYAGFIPGTYVTHNAPDRYKPKTSTPMDKALATPGTIYLGDLTQEWNIGKPYQRTYDEYGAWSPLAKIAEGQPKLWTRRK